jgi:hypothetical protein
MNNGMLHFLKIISGTYIFSVLFLYLFVNSYLPSIDVVQTHKTYATFLSDGKSIEANEKLNVKALNLKLDVFLLSNKNYIFELSKDALFRNKFNENNIFNSLKRVHFIRAPSILLS